jgi:hypothetical protein
MAFAVHPIMRHTQTIGVLSIYGLALAFAFIAPTGANAETSVSIAGTTVVSKGLVGVGRIPSNQKDKFGETFGSGSGMAIDKSSWRKNGDGYEGTMILLPDRGYNVEGTTDYRPRVNKISIILTPVAPRSLGDAAKMQATVKATLADTLLLKDAAGVEMTGLDPGEGVRAAGGGFPILPQAENGKVSLDPEAIVLLSDGSMLISDEYGPYVYRFGADGKMLHATQPLSALLPMRGGRVNFASNNPGPGAKAPEPKDPETGRQNNQGFEGMAMTPSGKFLVVVLQSAARQDGGDNAATRRNTRALVYDAADAASPKLVREHVVQLPEFKDDQGRTRVAAQSELVALSDTLFLLLSRDSNNGYGMKGATSVYRSIDLLDLSGATNIAGTDYDGQKPIAPKGKLAEDIVPAKLTPFININEAAELARFGLHNGAPNDRMNLSEKWEAMSLASALDPANPDDYFLFVANDNDFITQDGFQVGEPYKDASGADSDTMFLVYRVKLPMVAVK